MLEEIYTLKQEIDNISGENKSIIEKFSIF